MPRRLIVDRIPAPPAEVACAVVVVVEVGDWVVVDEVLEVDVEDDVEFVVVVDVVLLLVVEVVLVVVELVVVVEVVLVVEVVVTVGEYWKIVAFEIGFMSIVAAQEALTL